MKIERTLAGLHVTLRPAGFARYGTALFLAIWLAGWAAGEAFALWALVAGAWALITGSPMSAGAEPLALGPALAAGLFLLVWLSIWTLGGYAAGAELLRILFGGDDLNARGDGLEIVHRYGPFRTTTFIPRADLRAFHCQTKGNALVATTASASVELTRLGSPGDRAALADTLRKELQLKDVPQPVALPDGWREVKTPEGEHALVRDPDTRRKQARVATLITLPFAATAVALIMQAAQNPDLGVLATLATAAAIALGYGAARLRFSRSEWKITPGKLTLQRRSGAKLTTKFTGTSLELRETSDSDGDVWHELAAVGDATAGLLHRDPKSNTRSIHRRMNDSAEARSLGRWLAARARLPLIDRATPEAKAHDIEKLHKQLERSGRFGRTMSSLLKRARPK